jgi:hypothetical protein
VGFVWVSRVRGEVWVCYICLGRGLTDCEWLVAEDGVE